ncbi:MAG: hypothetical protein V4476_25345 [Pseudomonadota bacterium]
MRTIPLISLLLTVAALTACGGGGGGQSSPMPSGDAVSFVPAQASANYVAGTTQPVTVQATVKRPADFANATAVYALVQDSTGVITKQVSLSSRTATDYDLVLHTSPDIAPGRYTGYFNVMLCRDTACASQFPGSPMALPFDINASYPVLGTNASDAGTMAVARVGDTPPTARHLSIGGKFLKWSVNGPAWVRPSQSSGTGPATLNLDYLLDGLAPGTYEDTLKVSTSDGQSASVPVSLTVVARKLLAGETGVSFVATPNWSRLTRSIVVRETLGKGTIAWTAQSDQPWLTVTGSGVTGGTLSLSANSASLPADATSFATVTLRSSDPTVTNSEVIKVGLWKGSASPIQNQVIAQAYKRIIADPIRPLVYTHNGDGTIDVYHLYTGAKLYALAVPGARLGPMATSPEGDKLYVSDATSTSIHVFDLTQMAHVTSWPATQTQSYRDVDDMLVIRPEGVNIILAGNGTAYVAATGKPLTGGLPFGSLASTSDGRRVYSQDSGISPSSVRGYTVDYVDAKDPTITFTPLTSQLPWDTNSPVRSNGRDIAVSADGGQLYVANGAPYLCSRLDPNDLRYLGSLPGGDAYPNNVKVGVDGRVYCGISGWYSSSDVWVHGSEGKLLRSFKFAGYARVLLPGQMVISADGMMLIGLTDDPRLVIVPVGE